MCLDTFLVVNRIKFVCVFLVFSFWGRLTRGSTTTESISGKLHRVLLAGSTGSVCIQLLAVLAHAFVTPLSRAKCSFGARGALIPFHVALVALGHVELYSRQNDHSSNSGDAKR